MVAPLVAAGLKYGAGKLLESQGLPSGLVNPKGFVIGQIKSGIDNALGVRPGTTNMITDPKGALIDAGKSYLKDKAKEAFLQNSAPAAPAGGGSPAEMGEEESEEDISASAFRRGGKVKSKSSYKSISKVSSASRRGDGIAQRGKTKGRMR
jgi:hypothetical protein